MKYPKIAEILGWKEESATIGEGAFLQPVELSALHKDIVEAETGLVQANEKVTGLETKVTELEGEVATANTTATEAENKVTVANEKATVAENALAVANAKILELEVLTGKTAETVKAEDKFDDKKTDMSKYKTSYDDL